MDNELIYKIAITKIPKVGTITAKNLISYCGGVREVFEAGKRELTKIPGIGTHTAGEILSNSVFEESQKEVEYIKENDITPLFYTDDNYPQRLKQYYDSPVMLYYKGTANLNARRIVSIVGTRKPTPQGIAFCEELVEDLKALGVTIVSGLAYGIDVTAHKKSLEAGIDTIAVLGHGLKMIYPDAHRSIAKRMLKKGGLLTEFLSDEGPDREHFPMRNRIVAGICDALVVIESEKKGGSIITANLANGYSKDVFAVPGRVRDKKSQGCNNLIKTNRASLLESAADLAYIMRWDEKESKIAVQKELFVNLTEKEKIIIDTIQENDEIGIDKLSSITGIVNSEMAALLLNLEFSGLIKTLPGKRYILI